MAETPSLFDIFHSEVERLEKKKAARERGVRGRALAEIYPEPVVMDEETPAPPIEQLDAERSRQARSRLIERGETFGCDKCGRFAYPKARTLCYWCKGGRSYLVDPAVKEEVP